MVDIKLLTTVIHIQQYRYCSESAKVLVTSYVLPRYKNISHLERCFNFWDAAIVHQQLVAMLRGHLRFVHTRAKPRHMRHYRCIEFRNTLLTVCRRALAAEISLTKQKFLIMNFEEQHCTTISHFSRSISYLF